MPMSSVALLHLPQKSVHLVNVQNRRRRAPHLWLFKNLVVISGKKFQYNFRLDNSQTLKSLSRPKAKQQVTQKSPHLLIPQV